MSTTSNDLGRKVHEKAMKRTIMVNWMHENSQIIALLLSIVLIYVFDTNFDRGLKVRLFCSPQ
jgi:hypothetical protein